MENFYQIGVKEMQEIAQREDGDEVLWEKGQTGLEIMPDGEEEVMALQVQFNQLLGSKIDEEDKWRDEFDVPLLWAAHNSRGIYSADHLMADDVHYEFVLGLERRLPHRFHCDAYRLKSKGPRDRMDFIALHMPREMDDPEYEISADTVIADIGAAFRAALDISIEDFGGVDEIDRFDFEHFSNYLLSFECPQNLQDGRRLDVNNFKVIHDVLDNFFLGLMWYFDKDWQKSLMVNRLMKVMMEEICDWGEGMIVKWQPGGILVMPDAYQLHGRVVRDEKRICDVGKFPVLCGNDRKNEAYLERYKISYLNNKDRWVDCRGT